MRFLGVHASVAAAAGVPAPGGDDDDDVAALARAAAAAAVEGGEPALVPAPPPAGAAPEAPAQLRTHVVELCAVRGVADSDVSCAQCFAPADLGAWAPDAAASMPALGVFCLVRFRGGSVVRRAGAACAPT